MKGNRSKVLRMLSMCAICTVCIAFGMGCGKKQPESGQTKKENIVEFEDKDTVKNLDTETSSEKKDSSSQNTSEDRREEKKQEEVKTIESEDEKTERWTAYY